MSVNPADLYATNTGDQIPRSVASTLSSEVYSSAIGNAIGMNQHADLEALRDEATSFGHLLAKFNQGEAKEITDAFSRYARPPAEQRTPDQNAAAEKAAIQTLYAKHGKAGAEELIADAQKGMKYFAKHTGANRMIYRQGAGTNPDFIEFVANFARRKGWK